MKKLLLFTVCAFLSYAPLFAQITLDSATYVLSTRDTFKGDGTPGDFPSLAPATNATWSMNSLSYQATVYSRSHITPSPPYTYEDSMPRKFNHTPYPPNAAKPELVYHTQYYTSILGSGPTMGIIQYGENLPPQKYSISNFTGGSQDSISISPQNIHYSQGARTVIAFPATYHSTWTSSYDRSMNFTFSDSAVSLSNVPCVRKTFTTEIDSVVGWGKMRVKNLAAQLSGYMNVLQVKSWIISSDTIFINGNPAPDSVLAIFNLKQATPDTTERMYFYRVGEVSPLLDVEYYDGFTQIFYGTVHVQRLSTVDVPKVTKADDILVYPNPVVNHKISIDIPGADNGKWTYDIINVMGQKIVSSSLTMRNGQTHVDIDLPVLGSGIYYLSVKNNNGQVLVKPLDVVE